MTRRKITKREREREGKKKRRKRDLDLFGLRRREEGVAEMAVRLEGPTLRCEGTYTGRGDDDGGPTTLYVYTRSCLLSHSWWVVVAYKTEGVS